jgi:methionine-rich copper-binding protein CopC
MKRLAMLFIVVLPAIFFLIVEGGALAHIQPVFAVPAEGQEFIVPPERVRIFFGEPVEGEYLRVYDESGGRVDEGDATVSGRTKDPAIDIDHEAVYAVGLKDLLAGTYTVEYRITGLDGHTVGQSYEFRVLGGRDQVGGAAPKEANDAAGEEQQPGRVSEVGDPALATLLVRGTVLLLVLGILAAVAVRLGRRSRS